MKLLATIWMCLLGAMTLAQQPAFFVLGEDQFRGIQIYDVIQDKDLNYWFATNEGVYWFNNIRFERIECKEAKSNSAFNFVLHENGTIFCHNLNNQIFEIKDKQCHLFYELNDEDASADLNLVITDDGNLLIASRSIIVISPEGKVIQRKNYLKEYIGPPFKDKQNRVFLHIGKKDRLIVYTKGKLLEQQLNYPENNRPLEVLRFFNLKDQTYVLDIISKRFFHFDSGNFSLKELTTDPVFLRSESVRLYETSKGVWVAGSLPGVVFKKRAPKINEPIDYEDYFISDVFEDHEGNILLSTFDRGILVVPDMNIPDVISSFQNDPIETLYSDSNFGLILGSSKGTIWRYTNNQLSLINDKGRRPIEVIGQFTHSDYYLIDNGMIRLLNRRTGKTIDVLQASLKSVVFVSDTKCFIGTNRGVHILTLTGASAFKIENIKSLNKRVHLLAYDAQNKGLYVSTSIGLFLMSEGGQLKKIRTKGKDLYPNYLLYHNGSIYISTREDGILILKNGKVSGQLEPKVNGEAQTLKKMLVYKNTLIAEGLNGLYQFDMRGNHLLSIHADFGFSSKRVIDFVIHNNSLWVSHADGVQKVNLDYNKRNKRKPLVRIEAIFVNKLPVPVNENIVFASKQNYLRFIFNSPSLKNRETLNYHYRLLGVDTVWQMSESRSHQVVYNALPPGTYKFEVKSEYFGVFSDVSSYTFTIEKPIFLRWWFIVLSVLLLAGITYKLYSWQLNIQRRKSERINELNASKLTAIQSQMNPHFIFNSLNSIQDLILKGDVEHSYSYITTFSDLVRRTLNYSEKDFIDFEQETKLLELYLSLEQLRFKKDFNYSIASKGIEDLLLPPLLIQPFVENALVHGLLHKKGEKVLKISFQYDGHLSCVIEDNGIGRAAAKQIRQRQRADHESFSSEAIRKRFEILSDVFQGEFGYVYEDLMEHGEACGTRVTLHIPVRPKF